MEGSSVKLNLSGRRVNARDLMPELKNEAHFAGENNQHKQEADANEENIELGLGLSMNGRFGVDPSTKNLKRSHSVSNLGSDDGPGAKRDGIHSPGAARGYDASLERASSLPPEMEELWRRRRPGKELVSESGMEARKKRVEKMKSVRKRGVYLSGDVEENKGSGLHGHENRGVNVKLLGNCGVVNRPMNWTLQSTMVGSQRGSAEFPVPHGQVMMGQNGNTMTRNSSSRQILKEQFVKGPSANNEAEKHKLLKNALLDMPHVSTGPNHSRVEGILYRYRRADELKIVCVCHGLFLSPAEFVRHGGGGDVAQPLKHIVVNPFPIYQV